ncbi:MAG TPA: hypothetical protein VE934_02295 [Polaromonas sp.]|uniref:hypothetical protein n=1 Tax=Polaromonas sp. TaxID=1869339 RepID=UPI002D4ED429|nr:hypothetical protein [Polaromonas sp.]HYW55764.1 hypothetical protein [Polaromonas sp.]
MAAEYDLATFERDFAEALELPAASRWSLERDVDVPLQAICTMHPRSAPHEFYRVRLRWTDYTAPFSIKFLSLETGADSDQHAWPNMDGANPGGFFLCAPFSKEGNDHHKEWESSPSIRYRTPEQPLVFALLQLQFLLDNKYRGRG